jgi:hypothetical protein
MAGETDERSAFRAAMPSILTHEGVWRGTYRHLDANGALIDQHASQVVCEFPQDGPYAYIQHNTFTWADGTVKTAALPGVFRDGRLWWDVATFHGSAWETHAGLVLLHLHRKDLPGAWFWEIICRADGAPTRARTWHWFGTDGALIRRTLCDETRVA